MPENRCNPKVAKSIMINMRKTRTFPIGGMESSIEATITLIPFILLIDLRGLSNLIVLIAPALGYPNKL